MNTAALHGVIPPGTVVDSTTAPEWTPVRIEARLGEPVVNLDANPLHLDGPLAWGAYLHRVEAYGAEDLPPLEGGCLDFPLPLATWTRSAPVGGLRPEVLAADTGQVWGWACSAAHYTPAAYAAVEVRRRPATEAMAAFAADRKHHLALGPMKAKNVAEPATIAPLITWWALAEPERLNALLERVTHLGRMTRHGNGWVLEWAVVEDEDAVERWAWRQFPDPGGVSGTIRAPYHHPSRRMPCTPIEEGWSAWAG